MSAFAGVWQIAPRVTAQVIGLPFAQYRPTAGTAAIASGNLVATVNAWITGDAKLMAAKPTLDKTCEAWCAVDPALTQPGDYLVGSIVSGAAVETFYIASQDVPAPIRLIRCNQIINLLRITSVVSGGDTRSPLLTAWPGALIHGGGRAGKPPEALPDLAMMSGMTLLLPPNLPVQPRPGDVVQDGEAVPNDYTVQGVQHGPEGWVIYLVGA